MKNRLPAILFVLLICFACGKTDEKVKEILQKTVAALSDSIFPEKFAFSSPVAPESSSYHMTTSSFESDASFNDKVEAIAALAFAAKAEDCKVVVPDFTSASVPPECYGPALDYDGHLDALAAEADNGTLPTGDLGIWTEAAADGSACAAAKANQEIENNAKKIDAALLLVASMNCLLKNVPSFNAPSAKYPVSNLTSQLVTALENNPNISVTEAKITLEEPIDGKPVYLYHLALTKSSPTSAIDINFRYAPKGSKEDEDLNTTYKGKLWTSFAGGVTGGNSANSYAFSILFEKSSAILNYKMLGAYYDSVIGSPFATNGDVDVEKTWSAGFTQTISKVDTDTGLGSMTYAWQAGVLDSHARVFNIESKASGADTVAYAYFGYGNKFDQITGDLSDNAISKFICNWAGPHNDHSSAAFDQFGQKQKMKQDGTGKFVAHNLGAGLASYIAYAPVNACETTMIDENNANTVPFRFDVHPSTLSVAQPVVTSALVDLSADADFATFVSPTAPTDF